MGNSESRPFDIVNQLEVGIFSNGWWLIGVSVLE
jgi:hypothetical protein